jgi:hypothetical protein
VGRRHWTLIYIGVITILSGMLLGSCASQRASPTEETEARRGAIERVLAIDARLGSVRNERTRQWRLAETACWYARELEALDYEGTPPAFECAFRGHARAWNAFGKAVGRCAAFDDERGEMLEVIERLLNADQAGVDTIRRRLDDEWATWSEVEKAAAGAALE